MDATAKDTQAAGELILELTSSISLEGMQTFKHVAWDMINGAEIKYPQPKATFKFDFLLTKKGAWFYVNSSNDVIAFKHQQVIVEGHGEKWAVIDPKTASIVNQG